jgi:hypothetical protein
MPLPKSAKSSLQVLMPARRRSASKLGAGASNQLNMAMQPQQQTNWCWSAVSVSVKLFFSPGYAITQCDQANSQLGQTTCCANGSSSACNIPWYLDRALSGLGNLAGVFVGTTSFSAVQTQINSTRPVGCRIGWAGGGGHFVAIDGCDPASPNQLLTIKDPIYGTSILAYMIFSTAYQGSGSWTHSYLTQP